MRTDERSSHDARRWWCAFGATVATTMWWTLWVATSDAVALVVAIAVQVAGAMLVATVTSRRRTGLALALGVAIPALGPLAALAATVPGRGGRELIHDPLARSRPLDGHQVARTLSGALPAWEAVVSSDPETRRAAITSMSRRASSSDLEVLRWARARTGGEVALDVALAFDEASQGFEQQVSMARALVENDPGYDAAARAFRILAEGIQSGIVDAPVISRLAGEARSYHAAAVAADSTRARELLPARAQLELADRQPDVALELLAPAVKGGVVPEDLAHVFQQAAFAARRFDLARGGAQEGSSLAG